MKAVLISIQPYWVFLIVAKIMGWNISKEKTVEVRKNYPKAENWNKVAIIYCSKDKRSFSKIPKEYQPLMEQFLGKVIGEFVSNRIECFTTDYRRNEEQTQRISKQSCVDMVSLMEYEANSPCLYGWHISDLVIYDAPKDLEKVYRVRNVAMYDLAGNYKHNMDVRQGVTRPPQSWCYVDGVG